MFYHLSYWSQYDLQALFFCIIKTIHVAAYIPLKEIIRMSVTATSVS